ncbi:MAG TPA: GNAT family N-acetyltransferase, partial [Chroococcales cyanobacterium]
MDCSFTTADWSDILTVLRETYYIWSPGLSRELYQHYIWRQLSHPWARRNFRFMVLKYDHRVVASCKLYRLQMTSRGKIFDFTGVGSVYTQERFRNNGFATRLVNAVLDLSLSENRDGLILYSDIDPEFYEQFGFIEFGSAEFAAYLNSPGSRPIEPAVDSMLFTEELGAAAFREELSSELRAGDGSPAEKLYRIRYNSNEPITIEPSHIPALHAVYERWRRFQPFACLRDPLYWSYKLARERFLSDNSVLAWP